jgi:hypothetical protein
MDDNLTTYQAATLIRLSGLVDNRVISELQDLGYVEPFSLELTRAGRDIVERYRSAPGVRGVQVNLVRELQSLFPAGRKPGTGIYWRGSEREIEERLGNYYRLFKPREARDILSAARRYVKFFEGDNRYMCVLKYFIYRRLPDGSLKSELDAYIENAREETVEEDVFRRLS